MDFLYGGRIVRWILSLFLTFSVICGFAACAAAATSTTLVQTCSAQSGTTATGATVTCTQPIVGDVMYASVYVHNAGTLTLTVPTASGNWNLIDKTVDSTNGNTVWTYWHIVGPSDTTTYAWSWGSTAFYYEINMGEVAGSSLNGPIDVHAANVAASSTTPTSSSVTANGADLAIAEFAHSNISAAPTPGSGWSLDTSGNLGGVYQAQEHESVTSGTFTAASITTGTAFSADINLILFLPGINTMTTMSSGGFHQSVVISSQSISAYMPSYMYEGNISGGGANVQSTSPNTYVFGDTTSGATAGQVAKSANVRYMEDFAGMNSSTVGMGTFFDPANVCGTNGINCRPGWYNSIMLQHCDNSTQTAFYNDVNSLSGDTAWMHIIGSASPYTSAKRAYTAGHCATPTNSTLYENPTATTASNYWFQEWLTNAAYINSRSWYFTFWDNVNLSTGPTAEYPNSTWANVQAYIADAVKMLAVNFAPYKGVYNSGGPGGSNWRNNLFDAAHMGQACSNYVCNAVDTFCASNTAGTIYADVFERVLTSSASGSPTLLQNNLPFFIDTLSHLYNDPGCNSVDAVELEQPYNSSGNDSEVNRMVVKAVNILAQPNDFDGTANHRALLEWLYNDCGNGSGTSCENQNPIYPEYGLVTVPMSIVGPYVWGNDCDGNGTGTSSAPTTSTGGTVSLLIATNGTDVNGCVGAIYGRPFQAYEFGAYLGVGFVIVNQSNAPWTITDSPCAINGAPGCLHYGHRFLYTGSGPETCVSDQGTNIGTSSATCNNSTEILNQASANAYSGFAETTTIPSSIPACPTTSSAADCEVILLP